MRMLRIGEYGLDRTLLDDFTAIHHQDAGAQIAYDRQIMGNEKHGKAELGTQPCQQIQQLRLDRHISSETISSAIRTLGMLQSARPMFTRWRCPPDN